MNGAFQEMSAEKYPTLQLTIANTKFSYGRTPYFVKWIEAHGETSKHQLALLLGKDGSTVLLTSNSIKVANPEERFAAIVVFVDKLKEYFNEILGSEEPQVEWPLGFKGTGGFDPSEEERSLKEKTLHHLRLAYRKTLATPGRR